MRVKCCWNVGAYKAGTIVNLPEKEAYRLEKLGAVVILRVAPGEKIPEPDVSVEPEEETPMEEEIPEAEETPSRPTRGRRPR